LRGAEAIARILELEGSEYVFCYPDNRIIEAAAERKIRPLMPRTERTAVSMADGYSRMLNGVKIGTVVVQHGPGIENAFGGVAQAFSDSSPILVLAGNAPERRQWQDPEFDSVENFRRITKWSARIPRTERIPDMLKRAFTLLRVGRPGPVLLDVPLEVAVGDVDAALIDCYRPGAVARSACDPDSILEAAQLLLEAKRPLLHVGQGVLYAGATEELRKLAELLLIPVMTTLPGKSAFPEGHPLSIGAGGHTAPATVAAHLKECDVIFAVGASLTASLYAAPIPGGKQVIQLTVDERDLNKDCDVQVLLRGDAKLGLGQILAELDRRGADVAECRRSRAWVGEEIATARAAIAMEWNSAFTSSEVPISPYRVIGELMAALRAKDVVITHDSGRPRDQLAPFWVSQKPRGYLGWGKSTHLGYGLGLIMGAKVARPECVAVNIMGDSAFGMSGLEVETASRLRIPILTVVLDNSAMSFYERRYPEAYQRFGFKDLSGNYQMLAEALGAYSERIDAPDDLGASIGRALHAMDGGRPALLDVVTKEESRWSLPWPDR
jgi:acetolactate synthase-1/2/3 large subunit